MVINITHLLLLTSGTINLFLGFFILFFGRKRHNNILYALTTFSVSLWSFGIYFFLKQNSVSLARSWCRIYYLAAILIAYFFLLFSYTFPSGKRSFSWIFTTCLAIPVFGIIYFLYFTKLHINQVLIKEPNIVALGPAYYFYSITFLVYMAWAFLKLLQKQRMIKNTRKIQVRYVLIGAVISTFFGAVFNLILPGLGNYKLIWLGPLFTVIMVTAIAYAILKHHLFNIRVIATELFTALLILLFFINIFLYQTPAQLIFNVAIFGGAIIVGFLLIRSVLQEIKYRKRIEEAYKELKKLDKAKTEFISIASHQLRTPLTAVKGYISMILEGSYGKLPEKMRKPMENVYESNERLINLVNDLLNISRIETGSVELEKERFSIEKMASSIVEELKVKAEEKGISLKWKKPKKELPKVLGDRGKIRQVILNIIDNGIRYTKEGSVTVSASLKSEAKKDKILIRVEDTGEGLNKEEKKDLFKRFSRGSVGTKLYTEGVGLGLYIAQQYMKMHDGKIWAESEGRGKGSTFYIEIPIK